MPRPTRAPANRVDIRRGLAAGLALRPLDDTLRAVLADRTVPTLRVGLSPAREADLLARFGPG